MSFFVDRVGTLTNKRRTATGGFLVDAILARVGVLDYVVAGKPVRRYNSPEVLQASLDQLVTSPVTFKHPKEMVTTDNYQTVACGHIVGTPFFADGVVKATLAIQDAKLIQSIDADETTEVSMGYWAQHDGKPGADPDTGLTFDEARVLISWNHVAIVPAGRAGKNVRLMLDSADIPQENEDTVALKIKGIEVAADAAQAAVDGLEAELVGLRAEVLKAKQEAKDAADALVEKTSEAALDALVDARLLKEKEAKDAADAAEAAKVAKEAKLERISKAFPDETLDGRSDAFLDGLDLAAGKLLARDPDGLGALNGTVQTDAEEPKKLYGRAKMLADLAAKK